MANDPKTFSEELAHEFPVLAGLLREHLADYDEILPHVFMADVARRVLSGVKERRRIVNFLDQSLREQGDEIQNLIAVSFVENLSSKEEFERALEGAEAGALRKEWAKQHSV